MAASPLAPSSRIPLWQHRQLIATLAWRDVLGRYRGSAGGLVWSLVTPILMLAVYTVVFSGIFRARWSQGGGAAVPVDYGLAAVCGPGHTRAGGRVPDARAHAYDHQRKLCEADGVSAGSPAGHQSVRGGI